MLARHNKRCILGLWNSLLKIYFVLLVPNLILLFVTKCEIFGGLSAFSTCTNEPTGKDLCAGHVSSGECDVLLVG